MATDAGPRGGDEPGRETGPATRVRDDSRESAVTSARVGTDGASGIADVPGARFAVDGAPGGGEEEPYPEESYAELRPPRRLRLWQLAPIVGLAVLGSLMFAFPLAFEFGDGGAVVAMLGLLITGCAAGWGLMAARRVGHAWPGMPARGTGERPDWRVVALYASVCVVLVALAVWRVARLR